MTYASDAGLKPKEGWDVAFKEAPWVVHSILADLVKQSQAVPGRVGQRPLPSEKEARELRDLIEGNVNVKPVHEVLPSLMRISERNFAMRTGMSRRMVQRMLLGEYEPTIKQLRSIANVVGRSPAFFVEYRRKMLLAAVLRLMRKQPHVADQIYVALVEGHRDTVRAKHGLVSKIQAAKRIHAIAEEFGLNIRVATE